MMPKHKAIAEYWSVRQDECGLGVDWGDEPESRCWRCGYLFSHEAKPQMCHIIPAAKGGGSDPSNLVLLCEPCHFEAPDVMDSDEMWRWIRLTCNSAYSDSMGVIHEDFQRKVFDLLGDASPIDVDYVEAFRLYATKTNPHFGAGMKPSTVAWCMRQAAGCGRERAFDSALEIMELLNPKNRKNLRETLERKYGGEESACINRDARD